MKVDMYDEVDAHQHNHNHLMADDIFTRKFMKDILLWMLYPTYMCKLYFLLEVYSLLTDIIDSFGLLNTQGSISVSICNGYRQCKAYKV